MRVQAWTGGNPNDRSASTLMHLMSKRSSWNQEGKVVGRMQNKRLSKKDYTQ
jgi:hypothetical protein